MKAMLWKEFRENYRWALLVLLVLGSAEFYVLSAQRQNFQGGNSDDITLCDSTFLLVTSFGSAVAGAFLGAMQILPERKRDRWAALLHRPVSRSVIFFGKALAGLVLYLFATAVPFLASACYVALPGEFPAPFVPDLLWPGLSDLALGAAFYFGALLLCLEPGRWLGRRGALFLAGAMVFLAHVTVGSPYLLWPVGAALIFMLAAWGAIPGNSLVARRPWFQRAAFVLVVLAGVEAAWLLAAAGLQLLPRSGAAPAVTYTRFQVTRDGQVFRLVTTSNDEHTTVTDMAGKPVTDERYVGNASYEHYYSLVPLGADFRLRTNGYYFNYRGGRSSLPSVQLINQNFGEKENWYLLVRRNYLIGYDTLSRRCVGICDREGFKPPGARPVPFSAPLRGNPYSARGRPAFLWTDSSLFLFNFADRQFVPFFTVPADTIYEVARIPASDDTGKLRRLVVALEREIRVLDEQGQAVLTLPYLHDPVKWTSLAVTTNPAFDRLYLQTDAGYDGRPRHAVPLPGFLDVVDAQGKVLQAYSQPGPAFAPYVPGWVDTCSLYSLPMIPLLAGKLYSQAFPPGAADIGSFSYVYAAADSLFPIRWDLFAILTVGWAAGAFVWARRVGFSQGSAWRWG